MLEFEETNDREEPRGVLKPATGGYVMLPIDEYNNMLRIADAASNAITLSRRDYHKTKPIEATIDKHWLYRLLMDKLHEQYSLRDLAGYEMTRCADDLLVLDITLAKRPEPTEEA